MIRNPSPGFLAALCAMLMAGVVFFSLWQAEPPAPGADNLPNDAFSSERAMVHLRRIAAEPHPTGSEASARVRAYLLAEFRKLDIPVEVQTAASLSERRGILMAAEVHNVVARLQGSVPGKAVLLMCHYDSVSGAPGAADDGHAVAAMLETARALKAAPELRNDIIFLITDGEEMGLLGARAFLDQNPLARDVAVVYNMEGRGTGGAALVFETSGQNGWLIRQFADAAPYPTASSLGNEVYRRLPNDTDYSVFRRNGTPGLNSAFIEGLPFYHTPQDAVGRFDEGSLQQQGANLLAMAEQFGSLVLDDLEAPNSVYFSPWRTLLVHYPETYALGLSGFGVGLLVVFILFALRWKRITFGKLVGGVTVYMALIALCGGLTWLVWSGVRLLHPQYLNYGYGQEIYNAVWYRWAFVALVTAVVGACINWLAPRLGVASLYAGALLVLAVLQAVIAFLMPGASYVLTWPLLFSLAALWCLVRRPNHFWRTQDSAEPADSASTQPPFVDLAALALAATVTLLLMVGPIELIWIAMGAGFSPYASVAVCLAVGFLVPLLYLQIAASGWAWPISATAACVVLLAIGSLTSGFTEARPGQNSIFYALDAGTGKAVFASSDSTVDAWTRQFLGEAPQRKALPGFAYPAEAKYLVSDAPVANLPQPEIAAEVVESSRDRQVVKLTLHPQKSGDGVFLIPEGQQTLLAARLEMPGAPEPASVHAVMGGNSLRLILVPSLPDGGATFWLAIPPQPRLRLRMVSCSEGLPRFPALPGRHVPAR